MDFSSAVGQKRNLQGNNKYSELGSTDPQR